MSNFESVDHIIEKLRQQMKEGKALSIPALVISYEDMEDLLNRIEYLTAQQETAFCLRAALLDKQREEEK